MILSLFEILYRKYQREPAGWIDAVRRRYV